MKRADYDKSSLKCYHSAKHYWTQTVYLDKHAFRRNYSETLNTKPTAKNTGVYAVVHKTATGKFV